MHATCDGVLAALALGLAVRSRRDAALCAGWAVMGAAAALGALRYAGLAELVPAHGFVSSLSGWVSLPLVALHGRLRWRSVLALVGLGVGLVVAAVPDNAQILVGAVAVLVLAAFFARYRRWGGVVGVLGFPLAALLIGTRGQLAGLERLDLYHLTLAASVALVGTALRERRLASASHGISSGAQHVPPRRRDQ